MCSFFLQLYFWLAILCDRHMRHDLFYMDQQTFYSCGILLLYAAVCAMAGIAIGLYANRDIETKALQEENTFLRSLTTLPPDDEIVF